jgi:hypothetical protein
MRHHRKLLRRLRALFPRELTVPCGACGGRAVVCDGGGESPCDECGCTGKVGADQEMERLRAERAETMRRVRVVLAHFGVVDCDDPIAALEEVPARADAVVDDEVAHANDLTLQVAALRAIIEGRAVAPTYEEAVAHRKARGWWRWRSEGGRFGTAEVPGQVVDVGDTYGPCRWWAHDANDAPCEWPVATEASRPPGDAP